MSFFQNPVGGPTDPTDRPFYVEPVEEDKLTKGKKPKDPDQEPPDEKLGIAAFLLQCFRKAADFFLENPGFSQSAEQKAKENLILLKAAFEILKNEERSQDIQFLNELSKIWHHILEDALQFKKDLIADKFKALVKKIQHYPESQSHTLGYYLTEYAGQKWIPFPYMELIQKIHEEHEKNPSSSALTDWTLQINELLLLLKAE